MAMVSVVIPAMNEVQVIGSVVQGVHKVMDGYGVDYEVLVVDDGSADGTGQAAREAGARVLRHAYNMGNGAAIKTGIRRASGEILVMMDGDGQHNPQDIPRLLAGMEDHAMVVGARTRDSQTQWDRDVANAVYNSLASYICDRRIPDLTSGFRAIHTALARRFVYLLPNTFSYPTTLTLATVRAGHCIDYVPIKVAYRVGRSKIRPVRDGARFLVIVFRIATLFSPLKIFLPVSLALVVLGIGWYLYTFFFISRRFPSAAVVMILSGVFVFLMGLISEQIAQLRFDRSEDYGEFDERGVP
jgi:glycosyltransferase involved in cell wall biosynthesis